MCDVLFEIQFIFIPSGHSLSFYSWNILKWFRYTDELFCFFSGKADKLHACALVVVWTAEVQFLFMWEKLSIEK